MNYSHIVDGVVLDVTTKMVHSRIRFVYLGTEYIGQAYLSKLGWTAVAAKPNPLGVVSGFKNKDKVFEYLLKIREIDFTKPYPLSS